MSINTFGQALGESVDLELKAAWLVGDIAGHYAQLHQLSPLLSDHLKQQLWETVVSEPDSRCWTYLPYMGFQSAEQLDAQLQSHFGFGTAPHYLIEVDAKTVGWVGLLNQNITHRTIEIGNVYFSHCIKQSTAATEVIFLLLEQCFQQGFRRVEWKCNLLNAPSMRAAKRYGFQYEGTFRQHHIAKGKNRDTAWFSLLDSEWAKLKQAYNAWLAVENFDADQQQKKTLQSFMQQH